jgi:Tfp pilus assembly protein PilO
MSVQIPSLRDLPLATQRAIAFTLAGLAASALIVFFAVFPQQKRMRTVAKEIGDLNQTLARMRSEIAMTDSLKSQCALTKADLDKLLGAGVMEPLLGSFAMRGKSLLDPLAQEAGFAIESVKELPMIPLQLPKDPAEQTYGRQPVEFTGQGSYQQIAAFISKAEAAQPMLVLSSLAILSQQQTPEIHRAIISFEWPAKGEKRKPAPPPKKKR